MRGKVVRGASFRGLLNYLMDGGRGELIGGNMGADTKAGLSAEFGLTRSVRPDVAKPVEHIMLSLPPGDELTAEQWRDVASAYLHKMDMRNNQYCIIQHSDKRHQHVHLVVNRITQDGGLWYGDREVLRTIEACRQIEAEKYYLRETSDRDGKSKQFRPSYREQGRKRRGQDITRQLIHDAIQRTLDGSPRKLTPRELIGALKRNEIEVRPNISATGRINGFSFAVGEGTRYTGAKVGYKWAQLRQRIDYQPARDNAYLLEMIGRKPQEMAFSPSEFERYREALDKYIANPTIAVDFRDDIKRIGVDRLTRGLKELNNAHYQQLAALYEEQRQTWAKIRAQRPPMHLSARDMTAAAVMFAVSPALGALVVLPYALDRLIRHNRKAQAREISREIAELKAEIIKNNQRRDALIELRAENKQFMEEQRMMRAEERDIIRNNVENRINATAEKNKDFRGYIDYVNQSGIRETEPTYDELAAMYSCEAWRKNNAVLRGTDTMIAAAVSAAAERPENRALYILPMVFDAISKVEGVDDRIDGQTLQIAIQEFARQDVGAQYVHSDMEATKAEEIELLGPARERLSELTYQIRKQDLAEDVLPAPKINRLTGKVTLDPEEYNKLAEVYRDYHNMRDAYNLTQIQRYHEGDAKRELEDKIKETTNRLDDARRVNKSLSDRCGELENKTVGLSDKLEIIETFLTDRGLNKPLADWIASKAAAEKQMHEITQRIDMNDGMEM